MKSSEQRLVIGFLGGMGTYATIHAFKQYAEVFDAVKEWERPRIIIDNRCTMPSRVRAFLYNENVELLVSELTESVDNLIKAGCSKIILACNTSHLFLPQIYDKMPEAREYIMDIIKMCADQAAGDHMKKVYLLASEGTIESRIYQETLKTKSIKCSVPAEAEYGNLRKCIEAVKQNTYSDQIETIFLNLVNREECGCILGCTELPVLYEKYRDKVRCKNIYDPVKQALIKIKEDYGDG